jgi:hypothetical protein
MQPKVVNARDSEAKIIPTGPVSEVVQIDKSDRDTIVLLGEQNIVSFWIGGGGGGIFRR